MNGNGHVSVLVFVLYNTSSAHKCDRSVVPAAPVPAVLAPMGVTAVSSFLVNFPLIGPHSELLVWLTKHLLSVM